jgi:hypothetical protein
MTTMLFGLKKGSREEFMLMQFYPRLAAMKLIAALIYTGRAC